MPIIICPNCQRRRVVGFDTNDYVCTCNSGNPAIDKEDITIIGDWKDYDGEGTRPPQEVMRAGMANELQGTRAQIELNADKDKLTKRGNIAATHRQRQHLHFINLKKKNVRNKR